MMNRFRRHFGGEEQPDPLLAAAARLLDQHSAQLMEQTRQLIEQQFTPGDSSYAGNNQGQTETPNQEEGLTYADFVRWRRSQIARQVASEVLFQQWQHDLFQEQEEQLLKAKMQEQTRNKRQPPTASVQGKGMTATNFQAGAGQRRKLPVKDEITLTRKVSLPIMPPPDRDQEDYQE